MEFECRERFAKAPFICTRGEQTSKTIASIRSNLKGSYLKNDFFDFFFFQLVIRTNLVYRLFKIKRAKLQVQI